jgi:hypothetical protein
VEGESFRDAVRRNSTLSEDTAFSDVKRLYPSDPTFSTVSGGIENAIAAPNRRCEEICFDPLRVIRWKTLIAIRVVHRI